MHETSPSILDTVSGDNYSDYDTNVFDYMND